MPTRLVAFCLTLFVTFAIWSDFAHAEIILKSPIKGEAISTVSPELRSFLDLPDQPRRDRFNDLKYREKLYSAAKPLPFPFSWECTEGEEGPFTVLISEKEDFSELAPTLRINMRKNNDPLQAYMTNFLLGRTYYWKVEGTKDGKPVVSPIARFATDPRPPRLIALPEARNIRDLGGWTGLDGRRIRQGMIYRSSGLNYNSPQAGDQKIPDVKKRPGDLRLEKSTIQYINEVLRWKTDLDLRTDAEIGAMKGSPAGPLVNWIRRSSPSYHQIYREKEAEVLVENFRLFLDPSNYPIDFHCIAGADRTGSLAFILNGLLGVDPDDLRRDWEITSSQSFVYEERWDRLMAGVEPYAKPEEPFHKRIEAYLEHYGVTPTEIAKFRSLMLEDK